MLVTILPSGNLAMTLQSHNKVKLEEIANTDLSPIEQEAQFITEFLEPMGFSQISPEECGALTSATLIRKGDDVWGDMNYQVRSFIEELLKGETVIWQLG